MNTIFVFANANFYANYRKKKMNIMNNIES